MMLLIATNWFLTHRFKLYIDFISVKIIPIKKKEGGEQL